MKAFSYLIIGVAIFILGSAIISAMVMAFNFLVGGIAIGLIIWIIVKIATYKQTQKPPE